MDPNTYSEEQPNWQVPTFIPNSGQGERALLEKKKIEKCLGPRGLYLSFRKSSIQIRALIFSLCGGKIFSVITMNMNQSADLSIRQILKVPYGVWDLMSVSSFIPYCERNGLNTSREELEYFDKTGLMLPAVLFRHPIEEFRKIYAKFDGKDELEWRFVYHDALDEFTPQDFEKEPFFRYSGISLRNKKAVQFYEELGLLFDPSAQAYLPWKTFVPKSHKFSHNSDDVRMITPCYSRWQFHTLRFIKNNRQITVRNASLFKDSEDWIKSGENIKAHFEKFYSEDFLREVVRDYYKLFHFITDALEMECNNNNELEEYYWDSRRDLSNYYENESELESGVRIDLQCQAKQMDKRTTKKVKQLLGKNHLSIDILKNWRNRLAQAGLLSGHRFPQKYIRELPDEVLENTEDSYRDVALITHLLMSLGEPVETVKQVLLHAKLPLCNFCKKPMEIKRRDQKTCGDQKCKKELENQWKRKNYERRSVEKK